MKIKLVHIVIFLLLVGGGLWLLKPGKKELADMSKLSKDPAEAVKLYEAHLAENSDDTKSIEELIKLHRFLGNQDAAERYLKKLRGLSPRDIQVQWRLVEFYRDEQRMPELIHELEGIKWVLERQARPDKEELSRVYAELATFYTVTQQSEKRIRLLKRFCRLELDDRELHLEYLDVLLRHEKQEEFLDALQTAVVRFPNDKQFSRALMQHYLSHGDTTGAEEFAKRKYSTNDSLSNRKRYIEVLKLQADNPTKQTMYFNESLKAFEEEPDEFDLVPALELALTLKNFEFIDKGLALWKKMKRGSPTPWNFHIEKYAPVKQIGNDQLIQIYLQAADAVPHNSWYKRDAAYLYMKGKQWEDAAGLFQQVLALKPDKEHHISYLDCMSHGDKKDYSRELEVAYRLYPDEPRIGLRYADDLADWKQWDKALPIYQRMIALSPSDPHPASSAIHSLTQLKRFEDAYKLAQASAKRFPKKDDILLSCAELAERLNKPDDSAHYWNLLRERNPSKAAYEEAQLRCLSQLPDRSKFLRLVEERGARMPTDALLLDAAYIAQEDKRYKLAIRLWDNVLIKSPGNFSYHENRLFCLKNIPRQEGYYEALLKTAELFAGKPILADAIDAAIAAKITHLGMKRLLKAAERKQKQSINNRLAMARGYAYVEEPVRRLALLHLVDKARPTDPKQILALAQAYMLSKNWKEARPLVLKLVELSPDNNEYLSMRKDLARETGEWTYLEPALKRDLQQNPHDEDVLKELAYHYVGLGQKKEAASYLRRLQTLFPLNREYRDDLISVLIDLDEKKEAAKILGADRESLDSGRLIMLADLYQETGEKDETVRILNDLVSKNPTPEVLRQLGDRLVGLNRPLDARKAYDLILLKSSDPAVLRTMGQMHSWSGKPEDALAYYERYLKIKSVDPEAHIDVATLYRQIGKVDGATLHYQIALKQLDEGAQSHKSVELRARALAGLGRVDEAMPFFQRAVAAHPDDGHLYCDFAEILIRNKKYKEAEDVLFRAPKGPKYFVRTFSIWASLLARQRRYEEAIELLKTILKLYPDTPDVAVQIADLYERLDSWRGAAEYYEMAWMSKEQFGDRIRVGRKFRELYDLHVPQVHGKVLYTDSGEDRNRLAGCIYVFPLETYLDLTGTIAHQDVSGNGFTGFPEVNERLLNGEMNLAWRFGDGFRYELGMHGSDGIFGARGKVSYRGEDWGGSLSYDWRDAITDPIALIWHEGAQDTLHAQSYWALNSKLSFNAELAWVRQYLLTPPPGGPDDFFQYTSLTASANYQVFATPHLSLFYEYSILAGDQEEFYTSLLEMEDERLLHSLGIRLRHTFFERLTVSASYLAGYDEKRELSFGDYEVYSVAISFRAPKGYELQVRYLESTETSTGSVGEYSEAEFKILWRF